MAEAKTAVFARVLQEFKDDLSGEDVHDFSETSLKDLKCTITWIQQKQQSTRTMQNMTRLQGFLEAMETYSQVLDVFSNVHETIAFIWVSMGIRLYNGR
jgi:uncharacterized protein YpuA (DUF1002 family)